MVGAVTAVVGVLYALMQDDMKKLLAYSTVENIGVIVIGLGLALVFKASGVPALAALAMTAAMLHVLKPQPVQEHLVLHRGRHPDFDRGAQARPAGRADPADADDRAVHLIGAAAISACRRSTASWRDGCCFRPCSTDPLLEQWELKIGFAVIGALLSAALAAACFVRFYGIIFLGRPRSPAAGAAIRSSDADRSGAGLSCASSSACCRPSQSR